MEEIIDRGYDILQNYSGIKDTEIAQVGLCVMFMLRNDWK